LNTVPKYIFDFAFFADWFGMLNFLEEIALPEDWNFKNPSSERRNQRNPILENYITHTFDRLATEYNESTTDAERNKKIFINGNKACFNTGLVTRNHKDIYAYFETNPTTGKQPWIFKGFWDDSSPNLTDFHPLPLRAVYFKDISDLIYDTSLELRVNSAYILNDALNRGRIPAELRDLPYLPILFEGSVQYAIKKVRANYRAAVPQYYQDRIQFLLPLSLLDPDSVDLALAVTKQDGYYTGNTCLTLDMAYNNARLIAKPDAFWLRT
jgi:hypothetical protein